MTAGAWIDCVQLTPTHDGEAALVVTLRFANGGRSNVLIDADGLRRVMGRAGVGNALDLVGRSWTVLDIGDPTFMAKSAKEQGR